MEYTCPRCGAAHSRPNASSRPTACGACGAAVSSFPFAPDEPDDVELLIDESADDEGAAQAPFEGPQTAEGDASTGVDDSTPAVAAQKEPSFRAPVKYAAGLLIGVFGLLILFVCMGIGGHWAFQYLWNTPERALTDLVAAAEVADMPEAREYVSSDLWPEHEAFPANDLLMVLKHFEKVDTIEWSERTDTSASVVWNQRTAVPEIARDSGVWLEKVGGRWKIIRYEADWSDEVAEAADLLAQMRTAVNAQDAASFLSQVRPGDLTCVGRACRDIAEAVADGKPTAMVDTIQMKEMVPGTLKVSQSEDEIVFHWLQKTRYLDQTGMLELGFHREDERWVVTSADASNFHAIDDEMETWTENHSEMLWRVEMKAYVDVKSLTSYCGEWYFYICLTQVLPTQVKNVGVQDITAIKVSKVRSRRYMGNASQTLWGIYKNIAPGNAVSEPSTASAPVRAHGDLNLGETWEFYRVDWVEFADGSRLTYNTHDYRDSAGGTLSFEDVRTAREKGGMETSKVDELVKKQTENGYPSLPREPDVRELDDLGATQ